MLTYQSIDSLWWQFAFILIAGWVATDIWRLFGVLLGNRIDENAEILVLVRAVATALVAAVIAQLVIAPGGSLAAETSVGLRIAAIATGFFVYLVMRHQVFAGVLAAVSVLAAGMALGL